MKRVELELDSQFFIHDASFSRLDGNHGGKIRTIHTLILEFQFAKVSFRWLRFR